MFKNNELFKVLFLMKRRLPFFLLSLLVIAIIQAFCLNIVLAYIMKDAINAVVNGDWYFIKRAIILASTSLIIGVTLLPFLSYIVKIFIKKTMGDIKLKAFKQMANLTIENFEKQHTGELLSRMTNDVNEIEEIFSNQLSMLAFAIVYGMGSLTAIFTMEWRLGILIILFGLGSIFINKRFSKPIRRRSDNLQKSKGKVTKFLIDILEGIQTTKIFHLEPIMYKAFKTENEQLVNEQNKRAKLNATLSWIESLYDYLRYFTVLVIGLYLVMNNHMNIGVVAAIIHLQGNANFFFSNIGRFITGTQSSLAGASRVFELYDFPVESDVVNDSHPSIEGEEDAIVLKDIVFGYNESLPIINQLSLIARKDEVTAIIGPSGGGKSTILKLLMRFYQVGSGTIRLNGNNIEAMSLNALRASIAYVSQDVYLFDGTIEENIRYGKPNATIDEIYEVTKLAFAHDFIMEQTDGYQTIVGERGAKLSGGQKQRIAIARALLKNAPILLLDEATSALDSDSEEIVIEALNVLMKGRTTIAIAHRLSTIEHANEIYVIDQGKVVEKGNHQDLIEKSGLYKQLYTKQFSKTTQVELLMQNTY